MDKVILGALFVPFLYIMLRKEDPGDSYLSNLVDTVLILLEATLCFYILFLLMGGGL